MGGQTTGRWDLEADVVVVGFGAAGACAAIEAAEQGADVVVIDRFDGGGATRMSGGIVYLGGGTPAQRAAGFDDSAENMYHYLAQETRGVVGEHTLRRFCEQSVSNLRWLEDQGVRFGQRFCPVKTSYPVDQYHLYYSGNESFSPYNATARPAPRGHRPIGRGLPGDAFFTALRDSALRKGVSIHRRTRAADLVTDAEGRVVGLEVEQLPATSARARLHRWVDQAVYHGRYAVISMPELAAPLGRLFGWLERAGRRLRIRARKGVVLAAGGFVHNRDMVAEWAPAYCRGTPLGGLGDDGSGIRLGQRAGGATALLDRISAWRFINPPAAFVEGILVDRQGQRLCNEQLYGAHVGEAMVEHGGESWLIIDRGIFWRAHRDLGRSKATWFQAVPALVNLHLNRKKRGSVEQLARACHLPPEKLARTIEEYNDVARRRGDDPMGKSGDLLRPLVPPLFAIDCSLGSRLFVCATLSLGGLVVDEESGLVERADGVPIDGLYAAGRTAVGVTSGGYVSGLSIADGVFSGRRAGRHAAHS